ncbi:3-deoxy-D-manno-octulosonic acid transferase [Geobacter sp. FeAm09]|uniref:3-deoxy-D-manno-octulosonic acid transferase n=1 Tax=Geobacter sp. FeAm09 TaxID=2597769 RepID=UPI0011EBF506|nr:3-deoxy-D-manno-octulosonic acid transferase [Geobacter sp. FeAm09]QEM67227.1 3-deoxy-D-manno-octulosonic acid transferase [Geobacter sp. FeAm09]
MFYAVYNILSLVLLVPVLVYHLYRSVSRGRPPALGERFGRIPRTLPDIIANRPVIWLHAVSVGEAVAARPLLKALRQRYPGHAIVVSTTTETGRGVASGFPEKDLCIYFPFDFLPAVRRTLDAVKPKLVIIMETEIWPNFNREAARRGIPVILANGRISDRSYGRYLKFAWFFRHALEFCSRLCMQTATDRERVIAIGAPAERTLVPGNLKYDIPCRQVSPAERAALRQRYAIPGGMTVITAASTHPGEEEPVLAAYRELLASSHGPLMLVLVPRHPERAAQVAGLLEEAGLPFLRRTALAGDASPAFSGGSVLLVDTVGELMDMYALSDLAFVGGSLVPTGGHNLLEPASLGIPFIFGPHMTNFREIAALVLNCRAGVRINGPDELAPACRSLLDAASLRRELGANGLAMVRENGGATERHLAVIAAYV